MNDQPAYNHAFTISFEIRTNKPAKDVSAAEIRRALFQTLANLEDEDINGRTSEDHSCYIDIAEPYDSYIEEE